MGRIYVVRYIRMKFFAFSLKEMQDFVKKRNNKRRDLRWNFVEIL
jgi:hypothetical protein